ADLAERLYADIPAECPWEVVADLFSILLWTTSDNGKAMIQTAEGWLLARDDARRVRIALNLDGYPFSLPAEMEQVLAQVAERFPSWRRTAASSSRLAPRGGVGGAEGQAMEEAEWLVCNDLYAMSRHLAPRLTWRRVWLFAC